MSAGSLRRVIARPALRLGFVGHVAVGWSDVHMLISTFLKRVSMQIFVVEVFRMQAMIMAIGAG